MSSVTPIQVAAALVFRDGKLLIAQRTEKSHLGGLWEFPGGKREPGETWEACLKRELQEELAIEIEVGPIIHEITHRYPEKTVHLKFYRCIWVANEPTAIHCADYRWITRDELSHFPFPEADDTLVSELKRDPALWF